MPTFRSNFTLLLLAGLLPLVVTPGREPEETREADALFRAGKWQSSQTAYETALEKNPEGETRAAILLQIGYCQERQNEWEDAVASYRTVLDLKEALPAQRARANLRTGYSLRRLGKDEAAIPLLLAAADEEKAPPNTRGEGYLYAAWAYGVLGEKDAARDTFARVESIPEVHSNLIATALLNMGRLLQEAGRYEEALTVYRRIAEFNPVAATNRSRTKIHILECEALLSGDTPFHIEPFVTEVDGNGATITWVSQGESPPAGTVALPTGESAPAEAIPLPETVCRRHRVRFSNLTPGMEYRYEVTCGDARSGGSFRTAPPPGTPFSFTVLGDTQSYFQSLQPLLDALGAEKSDFVLHVGDLVDRGNLWGEWKGGFFDPGRSYLRSSVLRPAFGNHDGGPFYPAFFRTPTSTLYYSFDWGDARFIVLDSYGPGSGGAGREAQLKWLERTLAENDRTWTIVSLHVPMVATRGEIRWFGKEDFLPLLEKHRVDLVFSGHHPLYRRYHPIGNPGILHVTSGGGGGPVGGFVPSPLLKRGVGRNHYCRVDIGPEQLRLVARDIEGVIIDEFTLGRDWRNREESSPVESDLASGLLPVYRELLADRTFDLTLAADAIPPPGSELVLRLDLRELPRGPLNRNRLVEGARLSLSSSAENPWKIEPQAFSLEQDTWEIRATAPMEVTSRSGRVQPDGRVTLRLSAGGRDFEPFTTTARIVIREGTE